MKQRAKETKKRVRPKGRPYGVASMPAWKREEIQSLAQRGRRLAREDQMRAQGLDPYAPRPKKVNPNYERPQEKLIFKGSYPSTQNTDILQSCQFRS